MTSHRNGPSVLHTLTPVGAAVLRAEWRSGRALIPPGGSAQGDRVDQGRTATGLVVGVGRAPRGGQPSAPAPSALRAAPGHDSLPDQQLVAHLWERRVFGVE
ncbi:hypothetical protein A4E84_03830 [Streptomyces qaidamensis]|uniref:Uncharacterized protein n=1 Tax=Streptomyces qaidamensis TaxID=1783515 RepID=A0A143BV67_9ACTN|nr:hypothetical protein [Streptomyces qaidamensis]AMW08715.1 hypothetical protein A4E84_03830 [Streptomyces qaidamensis]